MMNAECFAFMGSMGWLGWLMPFAFLVLTVFAIAALSKYLFSRSS